jgi:SAM-dependent methyltransferase
MIDVIPLYDNAYRGDAQKVYRQIRTDTYEVDLGQTGWMDAEELREFLPLLDLTRQSHVLEVGCGSGGCALYLSRLTHAQVTGIDANASAIEEARTSAKSMPEARTCFEQMDATERLPFEDATRDATRTMAAVFKASSVTGAHAHRFRHTLATEILEAGGMIEDPAEVLGNSPNVIKKHYLKSSPRRQERISALMDSIFGTPKGTRQVHEEIEPGD